MYFAKKSDAQQETIRSLEKEKAALEKERGAASLLLAQQHALTLEVAKDEYNAALAKSQTEHAATLQRVQEERLEEMRELVTTAHALVREARAATEPGRRRSTPRG